MKYCSATFTSFCLFSISFQTNPAEIPIKVYSIVQTGAKIQFGGLKTGFISVGYQVVIDDCVIFPEKKPMVKQMIMQYDILKYFFILKILFKDIQNFRLPTSDF